MKVLLVILCLALAKANETQNATENVLASFGREFVELINRSTLTWTVSFSKQNFFESLSQVFL